MPVERIAAPAPPVANVLAHREPGDRAFVLQSGVGDPELTRWSYAGLEPIACVDNPFDLPYRERPDGAAPFFGGAVGYTGYDAGWALQPKPRAPRADPLGMPAARYHVYESIYARDEETGDGVLCGTKAGVARLRAALESGSTATGGLGGPLAPAVSRSVHEARIRRALELIGEGEIYQVNLTYPLEGRFAGDPAAAFLRLIDEAPPFAAYLDVAERQYVVSASPECYVDFDPATRRLRSFPIKGTERRAEDASEDAALASKLRADPKERAEHLMIVDLLRNDIGRLAAIGSVHVDGLAYVESFPTVHHLTSRVVGTLPAGVTLRDVQRALFPGGSITGAPKLRAMTIIDELEDAPRGIYTGSIGWFAFDGGCRSSIAIRTAQIADGSVRFGVGGGIVHDSDPAREWRETEVKAKALMRALKA